MEESTLIVAVNSPDQIAEVARLARVIWPEHYERIIGRQQVDYMLDRFQSERAIADQLANAYEYFLVLQHGEGAGYLAVVANPLQAAMLLSKIYVLKSARGQGLGKRMLNFAEKLCVERGLKTLWLTVNKHNHNSLAWYCRLGFHNAGPVMQDIGGGYVMDDFRMEKPLVTSSQTPTLHPAPPPSPGHRT